MGELIATVLRLFRVIGTRHKYTKGEKMIRKIIGTALLVIGGLLGIVLLTGGLVWPHIVGPITLVVIGAVLLTSKRKTS